MTSLKDTLHQDLTDAMRSRDETRTATLRMALTAVTNEEVSGKVAKELTDDQTVQVLGREAKKRREAADAYDQAERPELAARERAELAVLEEYLPAPLSPEEIDAIIKSAVEAAASSGATGGKAMGAVMKVVTPQVQGRADGGEVAAKVRSALGLG